MIPWLFALILASASSKEAAPSDLCIATGSILNVVTNDLSRDFEGRLSYCQEHERNSCCSRAHTDLIRNKVVLPPTIPNDENERDEMMRGVTFSCRGWTEKAVCGACDALAGKSAADRAGKRRREDRKVPICENLCRRWHDACRTSYITLDPKSGKARLCDSDSLTCWKAGEIARPVDFCELFGFAVEDELDTRRFCYDGLHPSAGKLGAGALPIDVVTWRDRLDRAAALGASVMENVERNWRRANGMMIWLGVVGALWILSWRARLQGRAQRQWGDDD